MALLTATIDFQTPQAKKHSSELSCGFILRWILICFINPGICTTQQKSVWHTDTVDPEESVCLFRILFFFLPVGISTSNSEAGACVCLNAYSYLQCSSSLNGKYMFRIVHYQNNINRMRIHHCYRLSSRKNSYYKDGDLVISPYNAILDSH